MAFFSKNTNKNFVTTGEGQEDYRKNNICQICEKDSECDKFTDHCNLTGKFRGPAHGICNIFVTQKASIFPPFVFTILVTMIVIYSSKVS